MWQLKSPATTVGSSCVTRSSVAAVSVTSVSSFRQQYVPRIAVSAILSRTVSSLLVSTRWCVNLWRTSTAVRRLLYTVYRPSSGQKSTGWRNVRLNDYHDVHPPYPRVVEDEVCCSSGMVYVAVQNLDFYTVAMFPRVLLHLYLDEVNSFSHLMLVWDVWNTWFLDCPRLALPALVLLVPYMWRGNTRNICTLQNLTSRTTACIYFLSSFPFITNRSPAFPLCPSNDFVLSL